MKRFLVAYTSRTGSTEGVAKRMAKVLKSEGFRCDVVDLLSTRRKDWPSPADYGGVILGSMVRMGKWDGRLRRYIDLHRNELNGPDLTLGVFSCSATAIGEPEKATREYGEGLPKQAGLRPDACRAFAGAIDLSSQSRLGLFMKGFMKAAAEDMRKEHGVDIRDGEMNDFRNWDDIEALARELGNMAAGKK